MPPVCRWRELASTDGTAHCAFTSGESSRQGQAYYKCSASKGKTAVLVGCSFCTPCKTTWRCTACYGKCRRVIEQYLANAPHGSSPVLASSVSVLLDTDWAGILASSPPLSFESMSNTRIKWRTKCPSCDDVQIPAIPRLVFYTGTSRLPRLAMDTYDIHDGLDVDVVSGRTFSAAIHVQIISVFPCLTEDEEYQMKARGVPPEAQLVRYSSVPTNAPSGTIVWRIIRTATPPFHCMSAVRFGTFSDVSIEDQQEFATACRIAAPSKNTRYGACKIKNCKGGLPYSSIRVNRSGGSNGHANGKSAADLKTMVCDSMVTGAIPRAPIGTIMVPIMNPSGIVDSAVPFYHATGCEKFTHPQHTSIPRRGSVAQGHILLRHMKSNQKLRTILSRFTACRLAAAYLFVSLAALGMEVSKVEAMEAIEQHAICLEATSGLHHSQEAACSDLPALDDGLRVGDYVMYKEPSHSDDWHPGVVAKSLQSVPKLLKILPRSGQSLVVKKASDVVGYAQFRPINDEDYKQRSSAQINSGGMRALKREGFSDLEVVGSRSNYTSCFDVSTCHYDSFGTKAVDSLLENKLAVPYGKPSAALCLPPNGSTGQAPPGSLCYPRYGVCTVLSAEDVEIHVLHAVMHGAPEPSPIAANLSSSLPHAMQGGRRPSRSAWKRALKALELKAKQRVVEPRGCWREGRFYPRGMVVLDW